MVSAFSLGPLYRALAPIGPITRKFSRLNAASWDLQYRLGFWDHLDDERAGQGLFQLMQKYVPEPSILDLGCGASANLPLVPGTYRHYHGVDISEKAIEKARALGRADTSYDTADILTYVPKEAYDAILLREVVGHLPLGKISGFLRRLSGYLTPDGVILVQIWPGGMNPPLTAAIEGSGLPMVQESSAESEAGYPSKIVKENAGRPRSIFVLRALGSTRPIHATGPSSSSLRDVDLRRCYFSPMAETIIERAARAAAREGMHRFERGWRRILRRPVEVQVGSYRMAVPGDMMWAFSGGVYYEQEMTHWLPLLLREAPSAVFYDIGANYGYYSLLLAEAADSVHAFEPVSRTRAHLSSALARNQVRNATVYPVALSDHVGSAQIRLFNSSGNNSLYDVDRSFTVRQTGTESVTLDTLDRHVYEVGLPPPGLIKMDVEGAELFVLRGGRRTLREHHPVLTAEFNEAHFKQAGYSRSDVVAELADAGYAILAIAPTGALRPLADDDDADNVLAVGADALDRFMQLA